MLLRLADGQRAGHGTYILSPSFAFAAQLRAAFGGEGVVLGLPAGLRLAPFLLEQALSLEPMERRVQCTFLDHEHVGGTLPDPAADGIAVARSPGDGLEDQEIEGAGVEIGAGHGAWG